MKKKTDLRPQILPWHYSPVPAHVAAETPLPPGFPVAWDVALKMGETWTLPLQNWSLYTPKLAKNWGLKPELWDRMKSIQSDPSINVCMYVYNLYN